MDDGRNAPQASPNTYKEQALYKSAKKLLGNARFGVTDDLFALGLTDEQAETMASEAAEEGFSIPAEDLRKYRTIRKTVEETDRTCRWLNPYDPEKPVLVIVHGVTPESYYRSVADGLKERFSVLGIEPIVEHLHYVFNGGERIHEVVDFYGDLIRFYLPEGKRVFGFLGHSFGGDIAYRLAVRWAEEDGERPLVYMIDTYLRVYDADHFEEYKEELLNRIDPRYRMQATVFWKLSAYCLDVAKKLGDGKVMPPYDGPVRLFSATQVKEDPTLAMVLPVKAVMREDNPNVKAWESLVPNLIVDYVEADHLTITQVPEFGTIFFGHIDSDLAGEGSGGTAE